MDAGGTREASSVEHWVEAPRLGYPRGVGRFLLSLAFCAAACGGDARELAVDVRTDYLPGRQFVGVRTALISDEGESLEVEESLATADQDFLGGVRIAEFSGLGSSANLRVSLLDADGSVLAERDAVVVLRGSFAVTILITSDCGMVRCPNAENAALTTCVGGRCVDPRCTVETPEFCGDLGCSTDSQCASPTACAVGTCLDRECFLRARDAECEPGFYCDLSDGCLPAGDDPDAGPVCDTMEYACADGMDEDCDGLIDCADPDCLDVECDDGSACTDNDACSGSGICAGRAIDCDDANPCTDDSCDAESGCSYANNTATCSDGRWCNGEESCADGVCAEGEPPCPLFCNESSESCEECTSLADCGEPVTGAWSACGGFANSCDQDGTQSRTVMDPVCDAGMCGAASRVEMRACTRNTERDSCGTTTTGSWSGCGSFSNACDTTGTRTRDVTTRRCESGACRATTTSQSGSCSRSVSDGRSCGGFWQRCCGGSCVNLANNRNHCGACRVDCGSIGCSANNGGYQCASCSSNSQCQSIYDGRATCYTSGSSRCNCQCPSGGGVCANGGCGANFFCHDESGHNFCSPTR